MFRKERQIDTSFGKQTRRNPKADTAKLLQALAVKRLDAVCHYAKQ